MSVMLIAGTIAGAFAFGFALLRSTDVGIADTPGFFEQLRLDSERISREYEENKEEDRRRLEITFNK